MSSAIIKTVSFIGAGNVAMKLAPAMKARGIRVLEVANRDEKAGRLLALRCGAAFAPDPATWRKDADLVIIAVSDNAIEQVASTFRTTALVVHTSGPVGMDVLRKASRRTGVLYPLQTFGKGRKILLSRIPFCIEAGNKADTALLEDFAMRLSGKTARLDSDQRRVLHLTAVFVANFPNFLYSAAEELLAGTGIPFGLLRPIILQTAGNAMHSDIFSRQTGPAVREDHYIMDLHKELLKGHRDLLRVYDLLSKRIIQQKKKHG